ncbi:hypothetical protein GN244_ATG19553 [Phytophthora infestans]|uniref:Uncharacterized protein n=1 Tax=Phytophthora infestans TaxID=4787 RepID=A0A833SLC1_PHYIN|nr:hypothetical protein GN244_ATG19553 [Phytophthora infestans]
MRLQLDALAHIKTIVEIDDLKTEEYQRQVLELAASINQEKEKRASALAQLIVAEFIARKQALQ